MSGRYGSHEGDIGTYRELDRLSEWLHGVGHAGSCDFVKSSDGDDAGVLVAVEPECLKVMAVSQASIEPPDH